LGLAADAARRLKKLSLETKLTDRMLAVCRTYVISEEQLRNVTSRREHLRQTAADLAVVAAKHLAAEVVEVVRWN
jgi:ferredoxin-fold anticodon binding domain-containing protein